MRVVVQHKKTREQAREAVSSTVADLMAHLGPVQVENEKREWKDASTHDTLSFSGIVRYGFIAVPVAGTVVVDEQHVTFETELPGAVKQFIGEDKIRNAVSKKLTVRLDQAV